ncbi:phosphoglucomutase, putative [Fulvimarina pelagi HTCC2506]|uniref:Phosphoglucomutase, putative n=1 Tax=Fulvimarina pelagi HTCC2506 TaxID=314231 RepID=Q0G3L7_9HYPH|nr:phosphomannomutase [Fulvimarina pelagi]EAU41814.1 phosphoglucomutase, putative [Fulvimarina pelagi HTCC2506]
MSSLKFGTSGLRGLVSDLDGPPAYAWTRGFVGHLERSDQTGSKTVLIGQDLRASSPSIAARAAAAVSDAGWTAVNCGALPTPALAFAALKRDAAALMVTGSHIPEDRNGLKFYSPSGEIDKADEGGIRLAHDDLVPEVREAAHSLSLADLEGGAEAAIEAYMHRYSTFFGSDALKGRRIGIYEQSSVARDILTTILNALGAETVGLRRADSFIPVDTEAHRPEDVALVAKWAEEYGFDAIVSTDGDADRPLVADETGTILRGDVLGMITAKHLGLSSIVTPVTSSSAIEASDFAGEVLRTRVGSPFVIAGMAETARKGGSAIIGFEANGGVLLGSDIERGGRMLEALPTRDAVLPILCSLAEAAGAGKPLSEIVTEMKAGFTAADRLKEVPAEKSAPFLARLVNDHDYTAHLFEPIGVVVSIDDTDGIRTILENGEVIHFRASGNAPELRCYIEAASEPVARDRLAWGLETARRELG